MAEPTRDERFPWRWVLGALGLGALFLGALWWQNDTFMDSDEAVVGLMARHIVFRGELPVFYWGQEYMGALEAYLAAPLVLLSGGSVRGLKLVPVLFTLGTIPIAAQVAWYAAGRRAAIFTAFAFAVPPLAFSLWSIKTRGGFTEQGELGLFIFWAALRLAEARTPRARSLWAAGTGLLLGLGLWWGEFIVPFATAGLLVLLLHPGARTWRIWPIGVGAAVLGALPMLWRNAFTTHWATVLHAIRPDPSQARAGQPLHAVPARAWDTLVHIGFPSMLGFQDGRLDPYPWRWPACAYPLLLTLLALGGLAVAVVHGVRARGATARLATVGTVLGGALMVLLFVFSRFGFEREPRYVLAVWLSIAFCDGWLAWAAARWRPALGVAVLALVLGFHGWRTYLVEPVPRLVIWWPNAPVQWSYAELAKRLEADGHTRLYADYWTGERLTYESREKVLAADPGGERYAAALPQVRADPSACFLMPADHPNARSAPSRGLHVTVYAHVPGLAGDMALVCP